MTCKFKVGKASEKILELTENTWTVYSTGTINIIRSVKQKTQSGPARSIPETPSQLNRDATFRPWIT